MDKETVTILLGAGAGLVTSLAAEGVKAWFGRRHVSLSASLPIVYDPKKQRSYYSFNLTITNDGGKPVHIVHYGIWRPDIPTASDLKIKENLRKMYRKVEGLRGWFRRANIYDSPAYQINVMV